MKRKIATLGILLAALSGKAHAEGGFMSYLPISVVDSISTMHDAIFNANAAD